MRKIIDERFSGSCEDAKRLLKKTKKMQAIIWTGHEKSLGSQEIGQTSRPVEMEATNKI